MNDLMLVKENYPAAVPLVLLCPKVVCLQTIKYDPADKYTELLPVAGLQSPSTGQSNTSFRFLLTARLIIPMDETDCRISVSESPSGHRALQ